jgi:hypothetical protein
MLYEQIELESAFASTMMHTSALGLLQPDISYSFFVRQQAKSLLTHIAKLQHSDSPIDGLDLFSSLRHFLWPLQHHFLKSV